VVPEGQEVRVASVEHAAQLLGLAAGELTLDEAAARLVDAGFDLRVLDDVEEFVTTLARGGAERERALQVIEATRSRLVTERPDRPDGTKGAARTEDRGFITTRAKLQGDFVAGVREAAVVAAHELRTPVAVAQMAFTTMERRLDDPELLREMIEVGKRNLGMAMYLLEGLARFRDGRLEFNLEPLDLGRSVEECVADVAELLRGNHPINVDVASGITVDADHHALRQIVFNLMNNAAKFSADGAPIEVSVEGTDNVARVIFRDHGPGIEERDSERIFAAGERLDTLQPGLGVGLFVSRQLAHAHGGTLRVEDASGGGAQFVLRLPVV
jgi:two-component system, OmpR family, sensor histidine kinase SenX3